MSWDYKRSKERIQQHLDGLGEIEIEKLVRDADLNSLLTETRCRTITGAHTYIPISNFPELASDDTYSADEYKRLIQGIHIYQREVSRIVESIKGIEGLRVHFQGPKLHALFYRPIDDAKEIARRVFFLMAVVRDFVEHVFNPAFPNYADFEVSGGADYGDVIGTRNGARGDRELLFLGAPANYAAKIIDGGGRLRLTERVYESLPEDLQAWCSQAADGHFEIASMATTALDELCETYGVKWSREASKERVNDDKRSFPLKGIDYSSANRLIDIDSLGITNNKKVLGASVFGDVTGFTAYIDGADTVEKKQEALRIFHAIRREMARVVRDDFEGVRVQFQGDRVQALYHLPKDDGDGISEEAVDAAVGLQSSMEHTLRELLPEAEGLSLAVGVDLGNTLVSKLGTRAHRDRICLGVAVESAAGLEEGVDGTEIGISAAVHDLLPDRLATHFKYDKKRDCYVAKGLTADKVQRAEEAAKVYSGGAPAYIRSRDGRVEVSDGETKDSRPVTPAPSYHP